LYTDESEWHLSTSGGVVTMQLGVAHRAVHGISSEFAIALANGAEIRIETSLELMWPGHTPVRVDPQTAQSVPEIVGALQGSTIRKATADEMSGDLTIVFEGAATLVVPSDADYEAWSACWPDGRKVVALPGGGLGSWGPKE
jgi:hypothetical protein